VNAARTNASSGKIGSPASQSVCDFNSYHKIPHSKKSEPSEGLKHIANLKGDLIRRNLVARTDLMRLYQLPSKRSQNFDNNPFFNKDMLRAEVFDTNDPEYRKLMGQQEALTFMQATSKTGVLRSSGRIHSVTNSVMNSNWANPGKLRSDKRLSSFGSGMKHTHNTSFAASSRSDICL
jgi:hypothetical protein